MDLSSLPKQKWWGNDCLHQVKGFWLLPQFVQSIDRVIRHFKPLPNDIVLASFPKTGTTWLKSLVFSIVHRPSSKHYLATEHPHDLVPTLEVQVYTDPDQPPAVITFPGPTRIFSTHIPYQLLSATLDSPESRVVYMTRNPKDTFVSMWHFVNRWKKAAEEPWPLEAAADSFCRGIVPCGCYYDHVIGYKRLSEERPGNVLFLTYEELIEDPEIHVRRLGAFVGRPFEGEDGEREVRRIVEDCSFDVLSKHEVNRSDESPEWFQLPYSSFFRKGAVGDYKNYLTDEVVERFDELTRHKFHSLGFFYASSGMDAQVSYAFHSERKRHPEKFKNQLVNQGTYAKLIGSQGWFFASLAQPSSSLLFLKSSELPLEPAPLPEPP